MSGALNAAPSPEINPLTAENLAGMGDDDVVMYHDFHLKNRAQHTYTDAELDLFTRYAQIMDNRTARLRAEGEAAQRQKVKNAVSVQEKRYAVAHEIKNLMLAENQLRQRGGTPEEPFELVLQVNYPDGRAKHRVAVDLGTMNTAWRSPSGSRPQEFVRVVQQLAELIKATAVQQAANENARDGKNWDIPFNWNQAHYLDAEPV